MSSRLARWLEQLQSGILSPAKAHAGIGPVLFRLGRKAEAIDGLGADPDRLRAWSSIVALRPRDRRARERLAELLEARGQISEAIEQARILAKSDPENLQHWSRLARLLTQTDQIDFAIKAWSRVAALSPKSQEAEDRLAQLRLVRRRKASAVGATTTGPRIAVLGNCQAFGIGCCLRALAPDAEVRTIEWVDISGPEHAERLAVELSGYDIVVSHRVKTGGLPSLQTSLLETRVKTLALIPSIHFTGFHPDILWQPRAQWRALRLRTGSYHSALVMACFSLGLDQARVPDLFNAYVYASLGYFEEYAKAAQHHIAVGKIAGLDLADLFSSGGLARPFVHVPNHPNIQLLFAMTQRLCARLGVATRAGATSPPDPHADNVVWPTYPEIARRLGFEGSLAFRGRADLGARRNLSLEDLVAESYRLYGALPAEAFAIPRLTEVCNTLRRLGV